MDVLRNSNHQVRPGPHGRPSVGLIGGVYPYVTVIIGAKIVGLLLALGIRSFYRGGKEPGIVDFSHEFYIVVVGSGNEFFQRPVGSDGAKFQVVVRALLAIRAVSESDRLKLGILFRSDRPA